MLRLQDCFASKGIGVMPVRSGLQPRLHLRQQQVSGAPPSRLLLSTFFQFQILLCVRLVFLQFCIEVHSHRALVFSALRLFA
jgi:hypothetical protein